MKSAVRKMKKAIQYTVAIFTVLVLTSSNAMAKSPPPGAEGSDVAANILFMVDTSGSMGWDVGAQIRYPRDVDVDDSDNIYVATYDEGIMKYDSDGNQLVVWGTTYGGGNGQFRRPYSLAVGSDTNVYVSDGDNGRVQKFDSDGNYLDKWNVTTSYSRGIDVDSSNNVYVVNSNGRVEKYTSDGTYIDTWNNNGGYYIDVDDSDNVYVTKTNSNRVEKYTSDGTLLQTYVFGFDPYGITVDSNGDIYVSRYSSTGRVYGYESDGSYIDTWYGFNRPRGLAIDGSGTVLVADYYNHRVKNLDGEVVIQQQNRLDQMKIVIKNLVSNSDLTNGANFGMMKWSGSGTGQILVNVSPTGAGEIYDEVDDLYANGGTYLGSAMGVASNYFLGGNSPMDADADCQQNIIIVISDGEWADNPDPIAENLYEDYGIETFTVGFLTTGNANYTSLSQAGGTYPDSPLFAENYQNLIEVLSDYILQVISSQLTFTAPTIVPGVESDDSILQSTFNYKTENQWKGHFFKYALDDNGLLGDLLWDAGDVLNDVAAADRQIWTVGNGIDASDINNFVDTAFSELRPSLEENVGTSYEDEELMDLINFVRGEDVYNEYPSGVDDDGETLIAGERWKLADVYHSRASVVGPPKAYASDEVNENSDAYYRYQNGYNSFRTSILCGSACNSRDEVIYVGSNGGMLHAFDGSDGSEKWAFVPPSVLPNFKDMIDEDDGKSKSIYGVDGSPTVKDIYFDSQWRTVLVGGLRQGGHSYYALDVTNPDSPSHMFTFAFNPLTNKVHYWTADGTETKYTLGIDTIPAEYDYSELGESWGQPVIIRAPVGDAGADKWVALIPGGYNSGINPNYGAKLFIVDLENNGEIVQTIDIGDGDGSDGIVNSVPPRLTAITADSSTLMTYNGALVYMTDLEGKMWKINLTDQGTLYQATAQFNNEGDTTNERFVYFGTQASVTNSDYLINIYGTGNVQQLENISGNIENRLYGIYDKNFPSSSVVPQFTSSSLQDVTLEAAECPSESQQGWMTEMDENEKITARITVKNGLVFVPRFTPNSEDICAAGNGRLTQHDLNCGSTLDDVDLGAGMPTEAVVYNNKVYIGVSSDADVTLPAGFVKQGNLIIGNPVTVTTGSVVIESWWEDF